MASTSTFAPPCMSRNIDDVSLEFFVGARLAELIEDSSGEGIPLRRGDAGALVDGLKDNGLAIGGGVDLLRCYRREGMC